MENCDRYIPLFNDAIQLLPAAPAVHAMAAARALRVARVRSCVTIFFMVVHVVSRRSGWSGRTELSCCCRGADCEGRVSISRTRGRCTAHRKVLRGLGGTYTRSRFGRPWPVL